MTPPRAREVNNGFTPAHVVRTTGRAAGASRRLNLLEPNDSPAGQVAVGTGGDDAPMMPVATGRAVRADGWPLAAVPDDYVLGHVRAVLPDSVLDDARVVVRDGLIAELGPHPAGAGADLDGGGLFCLPGLIDLHTDSLGRACRPRPGATVPVGFALRSAEAELLAAGVTTAFHAVAFQERSAVGIVIDSPSSDEILGELGAYAGQVRHRVLHRVDIRCPVGVARFRRAFDAGSPDGDAPLVSHEDHTPGIGQYGDPAVMRRWLVEAESMTADEAASHVDWLRADRDTRLDFRDRTMAWLGELAAVGRIRLAGHDPATADDIAGLVLRGGVVAEFPTTTAAARAARAAGLVVVAGAPNVLRGGSHSGNVSARELVAAGLVDALASDYLPSALLAAATELARSGAATLPMAVRLVTAGAAAAAGLADRGSLVTGLPADLTLMELSRRWPGVRATMASVV